MNETAPTTKAIAAVAASAVAASGLLVLGALTTTEVLVAAVLVLQGAMLARWFPALGAPGGVGGVIVSGAAAVSADAAVYWAEDRSLPLAAVAPALALALLAVFGHQLGRRDRTGLTGSVTATAAAMTFGVLTAAYPALEMSPDGGDLVVVAAVAAAGPGLVDLAARRLGLPSWTAVVGAGLVALVGAVVVAGIGGLSPVTAVAAAAAGALAARLARVLVDRAPAADPILIGVLPAMLAAPTVYVVTRLLIG